MADPSHDGEIDQPIKLSIVVISYNHEKYISRAIRSIIEQIDISCTMEIVIADDNSVDRTLDIIQESFASSKYAAAVRYLPSESNLGVTSNYKRAFSICRGEYKAVLEGDDYWTDPLKIKQQVEALDARQYASAIGHNYLVNEEQNARFYPRISSISDSLILDAWSIIDENIPGNFSVMMYRSSALQQLPPRLFGIKAYDWLINISVARQGPIVILPGIMSVYRVHDGGSWSGLPRVEKLKEQIDLLPVYDQVTDGIFKEAFERLERRLQNEVVLLRLRSLAGNSGKPTPVWSRLRPTKPQLIALLPPFVFPVARWIIPPIFGIVLRKIWYRLEKGTR